MNDYVNWNLIVPNATVIFSTLKTSETRRAIDGEVAALRLPGNILLDIEWDNEAKEYVLSAYRNTFRSEPLTFPWVHRSVDSLIHSVLEWSRWCGDTNVSVSSSTSTSLMAKFPSWLWNNPKKAQSLSSSTHAEPRLLQEVA